MQQHGQLPQAGASNILQPLRNRLDSINLQVVDLLSERMRVCMGIAELKAAHGIAMMQPGRISYVLEIVRERSKASGLRSEYTESIFKLIIAETCTQEDLLINQRLSRGISS
ncbi:chorismate mutase [Pseudomonas prosekii]|uniref:chorismate mutase n=1 Tax=Pseudomonas prosekii TaxID=1148509 RepID=A0A3L8D2A3_9PSED|nr:chorismate mutase [Pseudomonas prosekii]RLU11345.1 chorismate mutase [Pseudomonas prosekii]RLU14359.1 chorismate mutase [Pseudomonas prosekii]